MEKEVFKNVYDLGSAAYMMMFGYKAIKRTKDHKGVIFKIRPDEIEDFKEKQVDYLNSDFHRFDSFLMSLKKMSVYED